MPSTYSKGGQIMQYAQVPTLEDVITSSLRSLTVDDNAFLIYNAAEGEFQPGFTSLNYLSDTKSITSATVGQALLYSSSGYWEPSDVSSDLFGENTIGATKVIKTGTEGIVTVAAAQTITGTKEFTGLLTLSGGVTNLPEPLQLTEPATKGYVDSRALIPGAGLESSNNVVSISEKGVLASMVADSTITRLQVAREGITGIMTLNDVQIVYNQKIFQGNISVAGGVSNVPYPVNQGDAANKQYVDANKATAGSGVNVNGTSFSIASLGIQTAMLANDSVTRDKVTRSGSQGIVTIQDSQTITGNKSFSGNVTVNTPSSSFHASTKKYVDDQTVSASTGISVDGNYRISIANGGVDTNQLANDAVTSAKVRLDGTSGIVDTGSNQDIYGNKKFKQHVDIEGTTTLFTLNVDGNATFNGTLGLSSLSLSGNLDMTGSSSRIELTGSNSVVESASVKVRDSGSLSGNCVQLVASFGTANYVLELPGKYDTSHDRQYMMLRGSNGSTQWTHVEHYNGYLSYNQQIVAATVRIDFTDNGMSAGIYQSSNHTFRLPARRHFHATVNIVMEEVDPNGYISFSFTNNSGSVINGGACTIFGDNYEHHKSSGSISVHFITGNLPELWFCECNNIGSGTYKVRGGFTSATRINIFST